MASDTRGTSAFLPGGRWRPAAAHHAAHARRTHRRRRRRRADDAIDQLLLDSAADGARNHVFTLHAELEGGAYLPQFERLLLVVARRGRGIPHAGGCRAPARGQRHPAVRALPPAKCRAVPVNSRCRHEHCPRACCTATCCSDLSFTWLVLFVGLTVITMVGQLPQILGRAADHEIAPQLILEVLVLMLVANAPVLMLLTLLLAFVVTLGRMGSDSEVTAMRAAGFSPLSVLGAGTLFAAPVIAVFAVVSLSAGPRAYCSAVLARTSALRNLLTAPIQARQSSCRWATAARCWQPASRPTARCTACSPPPRTTAPAA